MKITVFATIGTPGSGKSTWVKSKATRVICPDSIRAEITGSESDLSQDDLVWQTAFQRLAEEITWNAHLASHRVCAKPIILDSTLARSEHRKNLVTFCNLLGADVVGVWFKTPLGVCIERQSMRDRKVPVEVIARMWASLDRTRPSTDEGFRRLYVVDNA